MASASISISQSGVDKTYNLHDGICGADIAKELAVNCCDLLPILYPSQQNSGADHVAELATESLDRGLDNLQTSPRLSRRIASRDRFSIRPQVEPCL